MYAILTRVFSAVTGLTFDDARGLGAWFGAGSLVFKDVVSAALFPGQFVPSPSATPAATTLPARELSAGSGTREEGQ